MADLYFMPLSILIIIAVIVCAPLALLMLRKRLKELANRSTANFPFLIYNNIEEETEKVLNY